MAINILYIGYWGANEGLTTATVIPHLRILSSFEHVHKIVFCSIERNEAPPVSITEKVKHVPMYSKNYKNVLLNKFSDFTSFPSALNEICKNEKINFIICRSTLAGIFGYNLWKKFNIPYIVESFEPHAEYMIEGGMWNKFGLRAFIQQVAERKQKKTASFVLPVSRYYSQRLIREGVSEKKVITMPCCVSIHDFAFSSPSRSQVRTELKIASNDIVGVYVGKYGDIYYTHEAFDLYQQAFDFFKDRFRLIILTGDNHDNIRQELKKRKISLDKVFISKVAHDEVPKFLSASDFAFSTIKPSPSRIYCSPIKNGEYWANGLPILLEPGIGEDSDIINEERGGILLNREKAHLSLGLLQEKFLNKERSIIAGEIEKIAVKHRNMELVKRVYAGLMIQLGFS